MLLEFFSIVLASDSFLYFPYSTDRPAHRMADKIAENFNNALLVVVR